MEKPNKNNFYTVKWPFGISEYFARYYGLSFAPIGECEKTYKAQNATLESLESWSSTAHWSFAPVMDQDLLYQYQNETITLKDIHILQLQIRLLKEFFAFAELLHEQGNTIEVVQENMGYESTRVIEYKINGKKLVLPKENYLNFVDYLLKNDYKIKGIEIQEGTNEVIKKDTDEVILARLERELVEFKEELGFKQREVDSLNLSINSLKEIIDKFKENIRNSK